MLLEGLARGGRHVVVVMVPLALVAGGCAAPIAPMTLSAPTYTLAIAPADAPIVSPPAAAALAPDTAPADGGAGGAGGTSPTAPEAPQPSVTPHNGGNSGSGGGSLMTLAPMRTVTGRVVDAAGGPIAGARVSSPGAEGLATGTTDADGAFSLTGRGLADQATARMDGYVTALVTGAPDERITVALRRAPGPGGLTPVPDLLPAAGQVTWADGSPAADVSVVGLDAHGGRLGPFTTDADGVFEGMAEVVNTVDAAGWSILAYSPSGRGLAHAMRVPDADGFLDPIVLTPAAGDVRVVTPAAGRGYGTLRVAGPGGVELVLADWASEIPTQLRAPFFAIPGVTLRGRVRLGDGDAAQTWDAPIAAAGDVTPPLPGFIPAPGAAGVIGRALAWAPLAGASGYDVRLRDRQTGGLRWEAATVAPSLVLDAREEAAGCDLEIAARLGDPALQSTRIVPLPEEAPL